MASSRRNRIGRSLAAIAGMALLLSGCGEPAPSDDAPVVTQPDRAEAAKQHEALLAEFGGAYPGRQSDYVARIGEKMAGAADLKGQCRFTLVNSDVANAFAVPGCNIYVTRGLLAIMNNEAELASVLSHELGHIVGRHGERQQTRAFWQNLGVFAASLTGSEGLTRLAGQAAQLFGLRYSRVQEYQSDDLSIGYLKAAGYDPYAASAMLAALGRQEKFLSASDGRDAARSIPEWALSHPLTDNRIERAYANARATGIAPGKLPDNKDTYLSAIDGMLYGDDPEQGFISGRSFAHPVMRIGFDAPEGFTLTNSPQAILLEGPDGARGEFAGGPMPTAGAEDYARRLIGQVIGDAQSEIVDSQAVRVNGLPALILSIRVATREGPMALAVAVYDAGNGQAYHFVMAVPPSQAARQAITALFGSFHLLSPEQAAQLRPRVLRIVRPAANDNAVTIGRRMADPHGEALFLMLNGRDPGEPLTPGEPVKVVTLAR